MTTDIGFLFAIAGVSMSVASIAGLVVAFHRTGTWAAHDLYRLRQIVEWGFANALLALGTFPLAGATGSEAAGLRVAGLIALAYITANIVVLVRRRRDMRDSIPLTPYVVVLDLSLIMLATATAILGTMTTWELALIVLVMRPMIAFLWVLLTLGEDAA